MYYVSGTVLGPGGLIMNKKDTVLALMAKPNGEEENTDQAITME